MVFKLAEDLGVLQADVAKVLTAIVILSMALTHAAHVIGMRAASCAVICMRTALARIHTYGD